MMSNKDYEQGIKNGKTAATLEGLAAALDEIKDQTGINCPIGKDHENRLRRQEKFFYGACGVFIFLQVFILYFSK